MNASKRFGRDDWLELGLAELSRHAAEGVRLEAICAAAGKTRGSFYHHFSEMEAYWLDLATHWHKTRVTAMIAGVKADQVAGMSPEDMVGFVSALDYRLELGLRELGRRDARVAEALAAADAERLSFSAAVMQLRYGVSNETAIELAMLDYAAFSGVTLLNPDIPLHMQERLCRQFYVMMDTTYGVSA